jgi:hypothetical protein
MVSRAHPLFEQRWQGDEYRFFQLGFVVDDLVAAATQWATVFGVGPFHLRPRQQTRCRYRGVVSPVEVQYGIAQAGPVQIELVQQFTEGPSIFRDVFAAGEFGLHQLCTISNDYDGKVAHYAALGYELTGEIGEPGGRVGYVDTTRDFAFYTEIVESTPEGWAHMEEVARTCETWDGRDPVRLITRDGYRTP